jgi:alpha/beta hydrolase fold
LEDLAVLAETGRPVVFYDQLGCGKSHHPDDLALWIMDAFVDEIDTVRDALGLDRFHLFGQSWGGWLALEYALGHFGAPDAAPVGVLDELEAPEPGAGDRQHHQPSHWSCPGPDDDATAPFARRQNSGQHALATPGAVGVVDRFEEVILWGQQWPAA